MPNKNFIVLFSYFSMSIKFLFAAFFAGNIPNISPINVDIINASIIEFIDTIALNGKINDIIYEDIAPNINPIMPPIIVMNIDSNKNWNIISFFVAPTDNLIPISFSLSETDIYIIFIIPTPAINSDIPAIADIKYVIPLIILPMPFNRIT